MEAWADTLCLLAQPKEGQFKNKNQSELTENWTIWKSKNQGVKKHSSRLVGRAEMGSLGRDDLHGKVVAAAGQQGSSWWTRWQTAQPRVPVWGNEASNNWLKTPVGVEAAVGETPSLTGEFLGPRTYTNPPTQEAAPEGPSLIVGGRGSDWKPAESGASAIAPYHTPPQHNSVTVQGQVLLCPG